MTKLIERLLLSNSAMYLGGVAVMLFIIWTIWSDIM